MKILTLCALVALLTGCAGQAKLVRELAKDNATVNLKLTTPWGSVDFHREMPNCNER